MLESICSSLDGVYLRTHHGTWKPLRVGHFSDATRVRSGFPERAVKKNWRYLQRTTIGEENKGNQARDFLLHWGSRVETRNEEVKPGKKIWWAFQQAVTRQPVLPKCQVVWTIGFQWLIWWDECALGFSGYSLISVVLYFGPRSTCPFPKVHF